MIHQKIGTFERKFSLRWRFDFALSPSIYSCWDYSAPGFEAWRYGQKEGLIRASIEGKNLLTREVMVLAECTNDDFCLFQWNAIAGATLGHQGKLQSYNVGLTMVMRRENVTILIDGSAQVTARSEAEQKAHYETFGR